ncbi:MAG TPA: PleD family two-component system response regulator [Xenococcaceae cyanobacterium]|jgi:chemotaxis family two-component system response regulator PixG
MENVTQKLGYDFLGIQDSIKALSLLIQSPPDLIFLDIVMPEMDGYTLCRQIKQIGHLKTIPIIMLTGEEKLTAQVKARGCGAADFIRKPITKDKILAIVEQFLIANKESEHESQSSSSLCRK